MTQEEIEAKYKDRAVKILERVRDELKLVGLTPSESIDDMSDEYLRLTLVEGGAKDFDDGIDISFEFLFSEQWDGEENGVNFGIQATHASGRMLGGLTPYNYTEDVWADRNDPEAVEQRFQLLEQADAAELANILAVFRAEQDLTKG